MPAEFHLPHLPKLVQRDLTGQLCRPVKPQFETLWEQSGDWFDVWMQLHTTDRNTFDADDALQFCVRVLQLRYRLCEFTNDALNLFDTVNFQAVIAAAIGWSPVLQWMETQAGLTEDDTQKKNDDSQNPGSVNGSCGPKDCAPTTDPHAANNGQPPECDTGGNS
jgi:hypothetical protein